MIKERNIGIDILKFFAVLFVTNSHMELLYGKYSMLATGGTIGDVLFLFCSGFTLFMKPITTIRQFPDWYKHRINRIYPTVLAVAIISCVLFNRHEDIVFVILHGGGWFVSCIMIYYVFIYFVGLYGRNRINLMITIVSISSCIWFFSIERSFPFNMYGEEGGYLKCLLYFTFMLFGAKIGSSDFPSSRSSGMNLVFAILGIVLFYSFYFIGMRVESLEFVEVLNFIPLLFSVYHLYLWGNGKTAQKIYNNKIIHFVVRVVGGLCLEIYLIQSYIYTDKLNELFPLNILIIFCAIVFAAYVVRCLARLLSQTFKENPYDWKKMIDIY